MRKIFFTVIVFVVAFSANCSAYETVSVTELNLILGNWYDAKGNLVLTISNDYKINGCTVLSVKAEYDTAVWYKIRIDEGNRYRDIELSTAGSAQDVGINSEGNHEWLILNANTKNQIMLRKSKNPRYFESVGGIYLGMHKDDVVKLYGQPLRVDSATWKYRGFDVMIRGEVVYKITIYKNSDRKFDWSGLSANNSLQDFFAKYNTTRHRRSSIAIWYSIAIWHGEVIELEDNKASLVCFTPGYVL